MNEGSRAFLKTLSVTYEISNIFCVHDNRLERGRQGQGMWNRGSYIKSTIEADVVFEDLHEQQEQF